MYGSGTTYRDPAMYGGKGLSDADLQASVVAFVQQMAPGGAISLKRLRESLQSFMQVDLSDCKAAIRRYAEQAVQRLCGCERWQGIPEFSKGPGSRFLKD